MFQTETADNNFIFDEYGRKFSKWVENTVGKGEIAHYKQFLFFSHNVFKRLTLQTSKNHGLMPRSSVGGIADLKTGGGWFNPWLGQYSFGGLMIVIATGFIPLSPLSPLSIVSTMVMWESRCGKAASGLERILYGALVKRFPGKHG